MAKIGTLKSGSSAKRDAKLSAAAPYAEWHRLSQQYVKLEKAVCNANDPGELEDQLAALVAPAKAFALQAIARAAGSPSDRVMLAEIAHFYSGRAEDDNDFLSLNYAGLHSEDLYERAAATLVRLEIERTQKAK